jgi:triosephosphate isomerase (TIM)
MLYFLANWKMYLSLEESVVLSKHAAVQEVPDGVSAVIFPSMLALAEVVSATKGTGIAVGAQHAYQVEEGAYTGAESFAHVAGVGASYALIGHSEQRHVFGETAADLKKQYHAALAAGLRPVVCVGETKDERYEGRTTDVVASQLRDVLDNEQHYGITPIIAYEPVWAISHGGVGEACTPDTAKEVLGTIRKVYANFPIVYGGSVHPEDVSAFVGGADGFNGVLVGHAATTPDGFSALLRACAFV